MNTLAQLESLEKKQQHLCGCDTWLLSTGYPNGMCPVPSSLLLYLHMHPRNGLTAKAKLEDQKIQFHG